MNIHETVEKIYEDMVMQCDKFHEQFREEESSFFSRLDLLGGFANADPELL